MLKVLVSVFFVIFIADGFYLRGKLPTYFEQCRISDPQLFDCFVKAANKVIPRVAKGDIHYGIPNMLPLKLDELVIRNDNELRFILRNVEVRGLENAKMTNMFVSFTENHLEQNITVPRLNVIGNYEMVGRLLNQQVNGLGRANITIINGFFTDGYRFTVDPNFWVTLINPYGSYRPQRVFYRFNNLLSGNDYLGYQTNVFLNNNWEAVSRSFQPSVGKIASDFVAKLYQNVGYVVTFNEALAP